jgi:hypothetical protein
MHHVDEDCHELQRAAQAQDDLLSHLVNRLLVDERESTDDALHLHICNHWQPDLRGSQAKRTNDEFV